MTPDAAAAIEALDDETFKGELAAVIPHLRAFGRSLCGDIDRADDLVQDTMLKAWASRARFAAGTSMRAWTFVILRNEFLSQMRRQKFHGDYDELVAERLLITPAVQEQGIHVIDIQRALLQLTADQREALILVGAGGLSYDEAAAICDVAVGTMKSRVSRGRVLLETILAGGQLSTPRRAMPSASNAVAAIADDVDLLTQRAATPNADPEYNQET